MELIRFVFSNSLELIVEVNRFSITADTMKLPFTRDNYSSIHHIMAFAYEIKRKNLVPVGSVILTGKTGKQIPPETVCDLPYRKILILG
jgi:hypothetical protein